MPVYSDPATELAPEEEVLPYLCGKTSDDIITFPDGTTLTSSGYMRYPNGSIQTADARGCYQLPDGSVLQKDMSIVFPDGSKVLPSGKILSAEEAYDAAADAAVNTSQVSTAPSVRYADGSMQLANGIIQLPDGNMKLPDGSIKLTTGQLLLTNGTIVQPHPDGSLVLSDGTILLTDGSLLGSDGTLRMPDGTVRTQPLSVPIQSVGMYVNQVPMFNTLPPIAAATSSYTPSNIPAGSVSLSGGAYRLPNGCILYPEGTMKLPDGSLLQRDGKLISPYGYAMKALPDGSYKLRDGSYLLPDGSFRFANGQIRMPDGRIVTGGADAAQSPVMAATVTPSRVRSPVPPPTSFMTPATVLPVQQAAYPGASLKRAATTTTTAPAAPGTEGIQQTFLKPGVTKLPNDMLKYPDGSLEIPWVNCFRFPDGSVRLPSGMLSLPDALSNHQLPDGSVLTADNTLLYADGRIVKSDGSQIIPGKAAKKKEALKPGVVALPNGMLRHPDGNLELPASQVFILADGTLQKTDGSFLVPEPDGSFTLPNNKAILKPDLNIVFPDGATLHPDGTVHMADGRIMERTTGNIYVPAPGTVPPTVAAATVEHTSAYPVDPSLQSLSQSLPDGSVRFPNGMIQLRNGQVKLPDGSVKFFDGRVLSADGKFRESRPDGKFLLGDGSMLCPNGSLQYPDGSVKLMDNTVVTPEGVIKFPDGSSSPAGTPLPTYEVPVFSHPPKIPVGSVPLPDGSYRIPNGCIQYFGGTLKLPNGMFRVPDGRVVHPNGSPAVYLTGGAVAISNEAVFLPDLNIRYKDGSIKQPDGCVRLVGEQAGMVQLPNGTSRAGPYSMSSFPMPVSSGKADEELESKFIRGMIKIYPGCYIMPNGVLRLPDGSFILPSFVLGPVNRVALPDGSLWYGNGVIMMVDGTVLPPRDVDRRLPSENETQTLGMMVGKVPPNSPTYSLVIVDADHNSPAEKAGLAKNDVLMFWNETQLTSMEVFLSKLRSSEIGEVSKLFIQRENQRIVIPVVVGARRTDGSSSPPPAPPPMGSPHMMPQPTIATGGTPTVGMRIQQNLTTSEVIVSEVVPGGAASRAGVLNNDVLVAWNEAPIPSPEAFANFVRSSRVGDQVWLKVSRQGQVGAIPLMVEAKQMIPGSPVHGSPTRAAPAAYSFPPVTPLPPTVTPTPVVPQPTGPRPSFGAYLTMSENSRLKVVDVEPGKPADNAGIQKDDYILKWNDQDLTSFEGFLSKVQTCNYGDTVNLTISRNGQLYTAPVTFEPPRTIPQASVSPSPVPQRAESPVRIIDQRLPNTVATATYVPPSAGTPTLGIFVSMVDDPYVPGVQNVVVQGVNPGGAGDQAGLLKDDVIVSWNEEPMDSFPKFAGKMKSSHVGEEIKLVIKRGGQCYTAPVVIQAKQPETVASQSPSAAPTSLPPATFSPLPKYPSEATTLGAPASMGVFIHMANDKIGNINNVVTVHEVDQQGAAGKAGVKKGDIFVSWNNDVLNSYEKFSAKMKSATPGETVKMMVDRQGSSFIIPITLTAAKPAAAAGASTTTSAPAQQPPPTLQPGESPWIGFAVKKAPGKDTIFVKDVVEAGPADRAGILDGDEMVSFGGDRVTNMEEFRAAVRKHAIVGHTVEVKYMRDKDGVDNAVSGTAQIAVGTRKKEVVKDVPTISTVEDVKAVLRDQTKLDAFSAGAFAEADADMSGLVSPAEFTSAMRRWIPTALVSWMSEDNFTDLFDGADMDHSGFVSKNEFPTLVESLLGMIVAHFKSKEKEVTVPPLALGAITGGSSSSSSSSSDLSGPRPTLGVEIKMLDDGQGGKENMVVVHSVVPEGPADKAGIMVNDGLLSWDGVALDSKEKFREAIKKAEIDSWISLDILRNGEQMTIPLQVEGTTEMKSPPRIVELVAP